MFGSLLHNIVPKVAEEEKNGAVLRKTVKSIAVIF